MSDFSCFTIPATATLLDAVEAISRNKSRAVLVQRGEKIIGVISEGDILRALLDGDDIRAPLEARLNYAFHYLRQRDMTQARRMARDKLFTLIPVLDEEMRLVDVITLRDVFDSLVPVEE